MFFKYLTENVAKFCVERYLSVCRAGGKLRSIDFAKFRHIKFLN